MANFDPELIPPPSPRAVTRGKFFLYFFAILLIVGGSWLAQQPKVQATIIDWPRHSLWENIKILTTGDYKPLQGEAEGRINFLLLGQGGSKHDGPLLTDTIMIASLKPASGEVALLSIPRDLVVPIPNLGYRKINSANAIGEETGSGDGVKFTSQIISKALDIPIHYYVRLDFSGFAKAIDSIGGVPVEVKKGFTDSEYPSENNGTITISFEPGWQMMSGERALEFVRSRHGNNGEGSDFARAKRQQQLLFALKNKLLSPATFLNPTLTIKLYRSLSQALETNLDAQAAVRIAHILKSIDSQKIVHRVLDTSPGGLLHETIGLDGAYLLEPNVADYSELKKAAANIFDINSVAQENAKIIIENGTNQAGLAEATAQSLETQGFTIVEFKNATKRDFPSTLIYDYTSGSKTISRAILETLFHTKTTNLERGTADTNIDFRIIIGADRAIPKP